MASKNIVISFLFSFVGLFLIIMIYCALGAGLFYLLEGDNKQAWIDQGWNETQLIETARTDLKKAIVEMRDKEYINMWRNESTHIFYDHQGISIYEYRQKLKNMVDSYHLRIARAILRFKYTGNLEDKPISEWEFWSGFLFSTSIVTLIGYGHTSPESDFGRLMVILYALMGVPLMLMFIANIGDAFSIVMRASYKFGFCMICRHRRKENHGVIGNARARRPTVQPTNMTPEQMEAWNRQTKVVDEAPEINVEDTEALPPADDMLADEFKQQEETVVIEQAPEEQDLDPTDSTSLMDPDTLPIPLCYVVLVMILFNVFGSLIFHLTEKWTVLESNYFCFVSLMTIGFGDYTPGINHIDTTAGKFHLMIGAFYIVIGLGVLGMGVNVIIVQVMLYSRVIARKSGIVAIVDEDGDGIDDGDEEMVKSILRVK